MTATLISKDIHRVRMEKLEQWIADTVALHDMAGLDRDDAFVAVIGMLTQALVGIMLQNTQGNDDMIRDFIDAGVAKVLQVRQQHKRGSHA